jgi:peptidoglycan hydrolase FlgJ
MISGAISASKASDGTPAPFERGTGGARNALTAGMAIGFVIAPATSVVGTPIPSLPYQLFTGRRDSAENPIQRERGIMQILSNLPPVTGQPGRAAEMKAKAAELEAAFLAEMLSHAGFGAARESFGGGVGEAQFASFLRSEQATAMVAKGGIGLAEQFFRAMTAQDAPNA